MKPIVEARAEKFRRALLDAIKRERLSLRELDRRTGHHAGYFSQVFRGKPRMLVDHIFEILDGIDLEPEIFFAEMAGVEEDDSAELDQMLRLLQQVGNVAARLERKRLRRR